ncbi:hypothetical protein OAE48_04080 [Flavobacteriales bacterium]|nr:hypothetical protein [Flavobacteriales bacterium]
MKKVNKNFIDPPINLTVNRKPYRDIIQKLEMSKAWPGKASGIYSSDTVTNQLKLLYKGKCAFCNQVSRGSVLQVEHFRPKAAITGTTLPGYYWLGYEWTNLLYACGNCNSTKGNYFDIRAGGVRYVNPFLPNPNHINLDNSKCFSRAIRDEKPLLVNPEVDDPSCHFAFAPSGMIVGLDDRGRYSIEKYDLNRTEVFTDGRKQILDEIVRKLVRKLERYTNGERSFKVVCKDVFDIVNDDLLIPIDQERTFDFFRYCVYREHEKFILPRFGIEKQKNVLRYVFNKLHQGLSF